MPLPRDYKQGGRRSKANTLMGLGPTGLHTITALLKCWFQTGLQLPPRSSHFGIAEGIENCELDRRDDPGVEFIKAWRR